MSSVIKRYRLELIQESAKRYECERKGICSPQQAADAFEEVFGMTRLAEEQLNMFCLDSKNNVVAAHVIAQGSLNQAIIHPREVYKRAVLSNAANIIICHNHPSGDCDPSRMDEQITERLKEAGDVLGIHLLDHIIIGRNEEGMSFCSLKDQGCM